MSKYRHPINSEISVTYIVSNKKLTAVAALGITLGIAVYIFMNSLAHGFDQTSNEMIFRAAAHVRVYKDDELSQSLDRMRDSTMPIIVNPRVVPQTNTLENPNALMALIRQQPFVRTVTPQITVGVFYNNGGSPFSGQAYGISVDEANAMFDIQSQIVEGSLDDLKTNANGIVLGVGVAKKMNAKPGDNISLTSSKGITKVMKVVALAQANNSQVDKVKSYINLGYAQQLLQENPTYITDINVQITDFLRAPDYAAQLSALTGYKAEPWQETNETLVSASKMRYIVISAISFAILIVAGFGIYNILNMTVSQKINDIAILKAMGFKGKDVVRIFVQQAMIIGFLGIVVGVLMALLMIRLVSNVYIGGDIGFFPIRFEWWQFAKGISFGAFITFLAGYIPARKAANVDPVSIFRK